MMCLIRMAVRLQSGFRKDNRMFFREGPIIGRIFCLRLSLNDFVEYNMYTKGV